MPVFCYQAVAEEFDFVALNAGLEAFFRRNDLDESRLLPLQFVLEELITNSMKYGAAPQGMIEVEVEAAVSGAETLRLFIRDEGVPFNPLEMATVDSSLPLEKREVGGLGIFLVRKRVRSMTYRRIGSHNEIRVTM